MLVKYHTSFIENFKLLRAYLSNSKSKISSVDVNALYVHKKHRRKLGSSSETSVFPGVKCSTNFTSVPAFKTRIFIVSQNKPPTSFPVLGETLDLYLTFFRVALNITPSSVSSFDHDLACEKLEKLAKSHQLPSLFSQCTNCMLGEGVNVFHTLLEKE